MEIDPSLNQQLHKKLPIDPDENVIAFYKHHWFAYVTPWFLTALIIVCIMGLAILLTSDSASDIHNYQGLVLAGAGFFSLFVLLGGLVPVYLRSQEQLVLTDESLLKLLKPTIFSHKVDQVGLQHVADVAVTQDFFGTMLGYGKLTIETPGEQRTSYDFYAVPNPTKAAQQISEMKENFDAALQSGRLESRMPNQLPAAPQIDPQQYQEFLKYQEMTRMQQQGQTQNPQSSSNNQPPENSGQPPQNQ